MIEQMEDVSSLQHDPTLNKHKLRYTDDLLPYLESMAIKGLNQQEMAKALNVSVETISRWKASYPQVRQVLLKARLSAVSKAEAALLKSVCGFEAEEVKEIYTLDPRSETGALILTKREVLKKVYAPNAIAAFFFLKNVDPHWRDIPREQDQGEGKSAIIDLVAALKQRAAVGEEVAG